MRIYVVSPYPIPKLEDADADLLVDDIIDMFQDNRTCAMNDGEMALVKKISSDHKYVYAITVEKL